MKRTRVGAVRYIPMDTVLELPRVRILRALRWFDWATTEDIRLALGDDDPTGRFAAQVSRLAHEGLVDRQTQGRWPYYRINDRGRAELGAYLAKTQVSEVDERRVNGGR